MKKLLALLAILGLFTFGSFAQEDSAVSESDATENEFASNEDEFTSKKEKEASANAETQTAPEAEEQTLHQALKQKFIEGGPGFMGIVVLCLILGLALAIERIIYLNLATVNSEKLLDQIEHAIQEDGIEGAKEICRNTRGPLASIFYQGLTRSDEGLEMVEKSVISYGGVQMGLLEKNLPWISLFIALAPMLGFLGTVVGMIQAFDAIAIAGDISPTLVADGIKVALITTVAGLIVAMILQVFYNYLLSKIDSIVNNMEDASITLIDILARNK